MQLLVLVVGQADPAPAHRTTQLGLELGAHAGLKNGFRVRAVAGDAEVAARLTGLAIAGLLAGKAPAPLRSALEAHEHRHILLHCGGTRLAQIIGQRIAGITQTASRHQVGIAGNAYGQQDAQHGHDDADFDEREAFGFAAHGQSFSSRRRF